jgi:predicted transcriptional regulator
MHSDPLNSPARFDVAFDRGFSLAAFIMNRHLLDHFVRVSRHFNLDFESVVIWGVVAAQNAAHLMPPGSLPSTRLTTAGRLPRADVAQVRPLRLRDVTQITGVPRETVRRKLRALVEAGWLVETEAGWVVNRDRFEPELREFTRESMRRFLAAAAEVTAVLLDAERAAAAEVHAAR